MPLCAGIMDPTYGRDGTSCSFTLLDDELDSEAVPVTGQLLRWRIEKDFSSCLCSLDEEARSRTVAADLDAIMVGYVRCTVEVGLIQSDNDSSIGGFCS